MQIGIGIYNMSEPTTTSLRNHSPQLQEHRRDDVGAEEVFEDRCEIEERSFFDRIKTSPEGIEPPPEFPKTNNQQNPQKKTYKNETFIYKYLPLYLRDFSCEETEFGHRESGAEYVLKTLIDIDDMNVLLVGGFNSGKTTMLYALAREYYYSSGVTSLSENNILFINNLKEQGIQFFRNDMKTFCQTHCSIPGKKKVILIDDMDSINKQSQQAFRNYIDNYKQHVCVIASCSNLQKVVESLQSRLHIVRIQPPSKKQIEYIMDRIISNEAISLDKSCRKYVLERSNDNICSVINNLEKMSIYGRDGVILSKDICEKLCSTISFHQFELYLRSILNGDLTESIRIIYSLHDYGYSVIDILEYFFEFIKMTNIIEEDLKYKIVPHICESISVFHNTHENAIELSIFTNNIHILVNSRISCLDHSVTNAK